MRDKGGGHGQISWCFSSCRAGGPSAAENRFYPCHFDSAGESDIRAWSLVPGFASPNRWESHFGDGGFRRLQKEGAWYQNCHYPYAGTLTGAGHASLLTGCSPATHGIVANEWHDRATGTTTNCVASVRYGRVPPLPHHRFFTVARAALLSKARAARRRHYFSNSE